MVVKPFVVNGEETARHISVNDVESMFSQKDNNVWPSRSIYTQN